MRSPAALSSVFESAFTDQKWVLNIWRFKQVFCPAAPHLSCALEASCPWPPFCAASPGSRSARGAGVPTLVEGKFWVGTGCDCRPALSLG